MGNIQLYNKAGSVNQMGDQSDPIKIKNEEGTVFGFGLLILKVPIPCIMTMRNSAVTSDRAVLL